MNHCFLVLLKNTLRAKLYEGYRDAIVRRGTRSVFESERYFLKTELVTLRMNASMKRGIKENYRRDEQEKWSFNELPSVTHAFSRAASELRSYVFIFVSLDILFLLRSRKSYKLSQLPPGIYFHRRAQIPERFRETPRGRLSERNALKMDFFAPFTYINLRELREFLAPLANRS